MGIRLIFIEGREPSIIEVKNREISYTSRKINNKWIKLIPRDEVLIRKIVAISRNRITSDFFNLTKEEKEEYDEAKDDLELSEICIRDFRRRGAVLQKREVI